jgi:hypothetical protein
MSSTPSSSESRFRHAITYRTCGHRHRHPSTTKSVAQLAAQNLARWRAINPEWAAHGPELVLTSRGTPGRVVASQGAGLAGISDLSPPARMIIVLGTAASLWAIFMPPGLDRKTKQKTRLAGLVGAGATAWYAKKNGAF